MSALDHIAGRTGIARAPQPRLTVVGPDDGVASGMRHVQHSDGGRHGSAPRRQRHRAAGRSRRATRSGPRGRRSGSGVDVRHNGQDVAVRRRRRGARELAHFHADSLPVRGHPRRAHLAARGHTRRCRRRPGASGRFREWAVRHVNGWLGPARSSSVARRRSRRCRCCDRRRPPTRSASGSSSVRSSGTVRSS